MSDESNVLYEEKIVNHLISMVARYPVGTTVKTNGETNGVVISQTVDPENPIIMILDEQMDMDEKKINKMNLMLEKNVSILQVVWYNSTKTTEEQFCINFLEQLAFRILEKKI